MATSGTSYIAVGSYWRVVLEWAADAPNVSANTTKVTAKLYWQSTSNYGTVSSSATKSGSISIDGSTYPFSGANLASLSGIQKKLLFTASKTITHSTDGTKSIPISGMFNMAVTLANTYYSSKTTSLTAILNTIPRSSMPTLSAASMNLGASITVYTNRASSDFTHDLTYELGGATGMIGTTVGTSAVFAVPKSLANQIPKSISGVGKVICKTYNGSTLIGTSSVSFTAWVPDTAEFRPTISTLTITDAITAIKTKFNAFVQRKSKLTIAAVGVGTYSSTISSNKITANNAVYTSSTATTGILSASGTNTITATVTDSRGRSTTVTQTIEVVAYNDPTITSLKASRSNSDGSINDEGVFAKIDAVASVSSVNSLNDKTFKLRYKKTTIATYTEVTLSNASYALTASQILSGIDENNSYDIQLVVTDYFTTVTKSLVLSTAFTLVDYFAGGKGIAFGEVASQNGMVVALDALFKGKVDFKGLVVNEEPKLPTLINGWSQYSVVDGTFAQCHFWKDINGIVHINGMVKNGTTTNETPIFNLPVGYRPRGRELFTVNSSGAFARLDIMADGNVLTGSGVTAAWLSLSGISFKAEK